MPTFFALLAGAVFGIGLILSGMADPAKVLGFLDLASAWDPSLALVMGGAILVGAFAFTFARKRTASLLGLQMRMPTATKLDRRLVGGSLLFGIGWGLPAFARDRRRLRSAWVRKRRWCSWARCWQAWRCSSSTIAASQPAWRTHDLRADAVGCN